MGFQDNAGGIVLDAALTDIGRKRMAQGNFRIDKFALGDDEIDYSLYKPAVGTGSEDFSKLDGAPIMEAFGGQNSNITYGLQNFIREDILHLPSLNVNMHATVPESAKKHSDEFWYFSVNTETSRKLETQLGGRNYVLENNTIEKTKIIIESGILCEPGEIYPTLINKERYLCQMGLYDKYFIAYCDDRYIDKLLTSPRDSIFKNDIADNLYMNLEPLQDTIKISLPSVDDNHSSYRIEAVDNDIIDYAYDDPDSTTPDIIRTGQKHSSIHGPRSSVFALNFKVLDEMTSDSNNSPDYRYTKFGTTSNALFGSADLYDFIDTTIYIQALSSDARISIPIRIVRYAGT